MEKKKKKGGGGALVSSQVLGKKGWKAGKHQKTHLGPVLGGSHRVKVHVIFAFVIGHETKAKASTRFKCKVFNRVLHTQSLIRKAVVSDTKDLKVGKCGLFSLRMTQNLSAQKVATWVPDKFNTAHLEKVGGANFFPSNKVKDHHSSRGVIL